MLHADAALNVDISIHAPREGGDVNELYCCKLGDFKFQSTPPARRATANSATAHGMAKNFNPRPPRGGRPADGRICQTKTVFQSAPPARGATNLYRQSNPRSRHFNPRPPRGGATHCTPFDPPSFIRFQSTPPARGATLLLGLLLDFDIFQSTPPARGATPDHRYPAGTASISIHAPREGGDGNPKSLQTTSGISIHAPREGATGQDNDGLDGLIISIHAPREGATRHGHILGQPLLISIHAPREGATRIAPSRARGPPDFNPRPPRGGDCMCHSGWLPYADFNPRPPRGGDSDNVSQALPALISIHAPREGATSIGGYVTHGWKFQSTPPARGRPDFSQLTPDVRTISIHAPREGGDAARPLSPSGVFRYFNPRPPRGGRPDSTVIRKGAIGFQSTPPARGATRKSAKK